MNRLKFARFLFVLFIVLTVVNGIGLLVQDMKGNVLGRIGLWSGFISQFIMAVLMYSEIRRSKKEHDD